MGPEATTPCCGGCTGSGGCCGGGGIILEVECSCEDCAPGRWKWLESTEALQREAFGLDPRPRDEAGVASTLKENLLAAVVELAESSVEFSWKYWAVDAPFVNRERVIDELVDVNHFVANMLVAVGCTDKEWEEAYQAKQEKNRRRMASGTYTAKKGGLGEGSDV